MKIEQWFATELRRWAQQPAETPPAEAARSIRARLRPRAGPRRRPVLRPVFVASAAALATTVAVVVLLRERHQPAPVSGTPASITLSSGTLVVIDLGLGEVRR
jgi:hypothetical protein